MKKLGIVLLVVAALILLFAPLATGVLTQSRLQERVAAIDGNPTLAAGIRSYERGWFASRVELEIGLSGDYLEQLQELRGIDLPLPSMTLPVDIEIYHGPVSFADGLHLGFTRVEARANPESPAAEFATTELGMPYLFEFHGHSGFGNRFDFEADVPPIDYAGALGEVAFAGLMLTGSSRGRELGLAGSTDGASYQNPFAAASVGAVRFQAEYEFVPEDVPLSAASLEIERIVASSPMLGATPLFEARAISLSGQLMRDPDGDRLAIVARYAAASLAAGEDFSVADAELALTLTDIDAAAARDYYAIVRDMGSRGAAADTTALLARLGPVLERIAAAGPRLTLDPVRFSMPEGRFEAAITATLDTSGLPPGQPADPRNIAVLFGALSVGADVTVAKPLAQRLAAAAMRAQIAASGNGGGEDPTPEELEAMAEAQAGIVLVGLVGQGLLQDAGEDYTTSIQFRNGALTVNGAPMPLGLL